MNYNDLLMLFIVLILVFIGAGVLRISNELREINSNSEQIKQVLKNDIWVDMVKVN